MANLYFDAGFSRILKNDIFRILVDFPMYFNRDFWQGHFLCDPKTGCSIYVSVKMVYFITMIKSGAHFRTADRILFFLAVHEVSEQNIKNYDFYVINNLILG